MFNISTWNNDTDYLFLNTPAYYYLRNLANVGKGKTNLCKYYQNHDDKKKTVNLLTHLGQMFALNRNQPFGLSIKYH